MRGRKRVLSLEEKGSLRPEMGKAAFPLGFRKEEVPHMAVLAKLDELHLRNTVKSWADGAESRNGRRLPHNSDSLLLVTHYMIFARLVGRGTE